MPIKAHVLLLTVCLHTAGATGAMQLEDRTAASGISFQHADGATGRFDIFEPMSAGLALFDFDGDGDIDLYLLNGAYPEGHPSSPPRNALYRNEGNWRFTDVTERAGVGDTHFGLGVTVGDYDNDGDADLYLNNHGPSILYRNNGDGTFTDVTEAAGLAAENAMGAGVNFLDIEGDGDLDLYVARYVTILRRLDKPATRGGYPAYLGPATELYADTQDRLYRNNGDGTFTDHTEQAGLLGLSGAGMGTSCVDFDRDGDTDIFVANDMSGNYLLVNDGTGRFDEMGLLTGIAFDRHGEEQGSMAMELGDVDNDGWLDLHITSYQEQIAGLYRNLGDGGFREVTDLTGAGIGTVSKTTWGNAFVDFDADGDRDLFIACGHIQPHVDAYDQRTGYRQANMLFENRGAGQFRDVSARSGSGLQVKAASRGAGFDDLDNDGDVDGVILNSRSQPTLLRNDTRDAGHWLQVSLRGSKTNRDGVGAQVTLRAGDLLLRDEMRSGRSYQSYFGSRLYFGLGERTRIDWIEVAWLGGSTERFENIDVDRRIRLVEGAAHPENLD